MTERKRMVYGSCPEQTAAFHARRDSHLVDLQRESRHLAVLVPILHEQADDRAYFTDASGEKWRVHDVSFGSPYAKPHHYHRFACGDRRATSRVFVAARGARRSYSFGRGEARELSAERCEQQLARADYLSDAHVDAKSRAPR